MDGRQDLETCPGCGVPRPAVNSAAHDYIGAAPSCWARYGTLLALEYGGPALMRWHRLTVDAYTAQHPGVPGRRSAQSVHLHLVGLYLSLERGLDARRIARALQALADGRTHQWLEPPDLRTPVGLDEAIAAAATPHYAPQVESWARAVWDAWGDHHALIRREAEDALTSH